jgi:hypothetical protein
MNDNSEEDNLDERIERLDDDSNQDASLVKYNKTQENYLRSLFRGYYYRNLLPENIDFQELNELYEGFIKSKKREELIMFGTVVGSIFIPPLLFINNNLEFSTAMGFAVFLLLVESIAFLPKLSYNEKKATFIKQIIDLRRGKNKKLHDDADNTDDEEDESGGEASQKYDEL